MNRRGLFPALAASLLLGVTAVVAQDLTDFDPKAIEARADTDREFTVSITVTLRNWSKRPAFWK